MEKQKKYTIAKLHLLLLQIIVFILPLHQKFIPITIVCWVIVSIILILKEKRQFQFNWGVALLLGFYVFLILGVFWSENNKVALFDLEVKMSLAVFPIVLSFLGLSKKEMFAILKAFTLGVVVTSIILVISAFKTYFVSQDMYDLFYTNLSPIIHPTYLSLYIVVVFVYLFETILQKQNYPLEKIAKKIKINPAIISVVLAIWLLFFNFILLSKSGILVGTLFAVFYVVKWMIRTRRYIIGMGIFSFILFSIYFGYNSSGYAKQRIHELFVALSTDDPNSESSSSVRLKIWDEAIELIKEKPIVGYGTGDVKLELMKQYKKHGLTKAYNDQLNAHNQFLQILISVGIIGFAFFMGAMLIAFMNGWSSNNPFLYSFIILFFLYCLTESILENQAGTLFFGLFFSVFLISNKKTQLKTDL